jgi:hypothetical protein
VDRVQQTIDAAADAAVTDAIGLVKNHPDYQHIVQVLAGKALEALTAGL